MPRTFHALKVPKPRQDWSKYNLYNLQRIRSLRLNDKTFFQQKWAAKNLGRSYHNPYVREGQWSRMFDRRLPAVVPLDFRYLAENDGSEQATGRGMGVEAEEDKRRLQRDGQRATKTNKTPYMNMAFHPLERRLDTAIFRALFASSTKQARQMVVHGWVKVNGKKMTYPGYMLNPGDMFSVDPERVLYATGEPKPRQQVSGGVKKAAAAEGEEASEEAPEEAQEEASSEETEVKASKKDAAEPESTAQSGPVAKTPEETKEILRKLMMRAKWITNSAKGDLSGRRLKDLRTLTKSIRKTMSNFGARKSVESADVTLEELTNTLEDVVSKIPEQALPAAEAPKSSESDAQTPGPQKEAEHSPSKDAQLLFKAMQRARENPIDRSKPYKTPWRPRDYMSAFAFIPRYLEVNQNICSAVYLRHPVARPGLAEVPTPVSSEISGLIFNWYLRRR